MFLSILFLLLLIILNGVFAMAELALVAARRARLQTAAEDGSRGAATALKLLANTGRFLSSVSIGITLIGTMVSTISGATFVDAIAEQLTGLPYIHLYAHAVAVVLVVLIITVTSLVIGELVPKRLALAHPEAIAASLARFMALFARVTAPAEWLLSRLTDLVLTLVPVSRDRKASVTDDEINLLMREGAAAGHFHQTESEIVQMALRLGDRKVDALMTPRTQVEWLDLEDGLEANLAKIRQSSFSRFPVVEGGPDQVLGILQLKDLVVGSLSGEPPDLRGAVRPPLFVPDTVPALRMLEMLKTSGQPMALIVDEYGDFEGIITLHDILETLVGDIAEPGDGTEHPVVRREDGSWLIDGLISIDDLKDAIGVNRLPAEGSGDFHTLGGFLMAQMKRVPSVADHVDVDGWRFEVVGMDGHRVDRVIVVPPKGRASTEG
ncbi:MAG TPA: hemolysin family protein [Stellaceae bacterium]|nr:hemolysin family protein [Stellaceae bacterium]